MTTIINEIYVEDGNLTIICTTDNIDFRYDYSINENITYTIQEVNHGGILPRYEVMITKPGVSEKVLRRRVGEIHQAIEVEDYYLLIIILKICREESKTSPRKNAIELKKYESGTDELKKMLRGRK